MGLDIWFAEDIRNALLAANEASAATAAVIAELGGSLSSISGEAVTDSARLLAMSLRAYREGYRAALATVALAFGIAPQAITLRPVQDSALWPAQDKALRPFDCAQDRPLDELGTMPARDKALRGAQDTAGQCDPPNKIPQRGRMPGTTCLSPEVGGG